MVLPIGYENIEGNLITLWIDDDTITFDEREEGGSAAVGKAVGIVLSDTVELVADGDAIYGELVSVAGDGAAVVRKGGPVTLSAGTSHGISAGTRGIVGALLSGAKGYVRAANSAQAAEILAARGVCLNAADTTALKIDLG